MWEVFEAERPYLMAYRGPFDGFHAVEGGGVATTHILLFYKRLLSTSNSVPHTCSNAGDQHQTTCSQSAQVTLGRPVKARRK